MLGLSLWSWFLAPALEPFENSVSRFSWNGSLLTLSWPPLSLNGSACTSLVSFFSLPSLLLSFYSSEPCLCENTKEVTLPFFILTCRLTADWRQRPCCLLRGQKSVLGAMVSVIPGPWCAAALEGLQSSIDTPFIIDRVGLYKQPPVNYFLFSSAGLTWRWQHIQSVWTHISADIAPRITCLPLGLGPCRSRSLPAACGTNCLTLCAGSWALRIIQLVFWEQES